MRAGTVGLGGGGVRGAVPGAGEEDLYGNGVMREPPIAAGIELADGTVVDGAKMCRMADALFEGMIGEDPGFRALVDSCSQRGMGPAIAADQLAREAIKLVLRAGHVKPPLTSTGTINTAYTNTSLPETDYPGDLAADQRIIGATRWNAAAMVLKANKELPGIGGHAATGQSNAVLQLELLLHRLNAENTEHGGDVYFIQGHDAPICYAFEHLLGNLTDEQMRHFRQDVDGKGISSYPHRILMPKFWHVSSVSMGLAPQLAVRYAQLMRYARDHELYKGPERHVWCVLGDGSLAEPETWGDLDVAARLGLDNLTYIINANLIGLDQPVTPNDQIIQQTEARFRGNGWNVIKLIFGSSWDAIIARDSGGLIAKRMGELADGDLQRLTRSDGATIREEFFGQTKSRDGEANPALLALVEHLSDAEIVELFKDWGGHDPVKVNQAYQAALNHKGKPTVIIAMTTKGRDMGSAEASDGSHSAKKVSDDDAIHMARRLGVGITDDAATHFEFAEISDADRAYLAAQREKLGGAFFRERKGMPVPVAMPADTAFAGKGVLESTLKGEIPVRGTRDDELHHYLTTVVPTWKQNERHPQANEVSTTMSFASIIKELMRDPATAKAVMQIIADEAETFGMKNLLKMVGEYDPRIANYVSTHKGSPTEIVIGPGGKIIQVGISESAAMAVFTAAGMEGLIPFFIGYSAFFPRRVADQIFAAADMKVRGFMLAATSGGTAINGEGTQHEERADILKILENEAVLPYDPAFGYELAILIREYLRQMIVDGRNIMPYINVYNDAYPQPGIPKGLDPKALTEGILKGLYKFTDADFVFGNTDRPVQRAQIMASGPMMIQAIKAQRLLATEFGVYADLWSATSYPMLMRDARKVEFQNVMRPEGGRQESYLQRTLGHTPGPIVAVSDFMRAVPGMIAPYMDSRRLHLLGTDGFGRSDTRDKLRDFFGVDARHIAYQVLYGLYLEGQNPVAAARGPAARRRARELGASITLDQLMRARSQLGISPDKQYPPEWPKI